MLDGRISLNVPYTMNKDAEILFSFEREGGGGRRDTCDGKASHPGLVAVLLGGWATCLENRLTHVISITLGGSSFPPFQVKLELRMLVFVEEEIPKDPE